MPSSSQPSDGEHVERIAAEWSLRVLQGITDAEEKQLARWLQADRRHAAVFGEMNETSRLLDQLRDPLLAGESTVSAGNAAALNPVSVTNISAPKRKGLAWFIPVSAAAAAAIAFAWVQWGGPLFATEPFAQTAATEVGVWRTLKLPDGSVVQLNTDSAVDVRYTTTERRVRLARGEAFFTVARNPTRPFWVEARTVAVRAVGTAFNVRHRPGAIEVLVTEGKVRLDSARSSAASIDSQPLTPAAAKPPQRQDETPRPVHRRQLLAGQKAVVPVAVDPINPPTPIAIDSIELPRIGRALAWQERRLEFADVPLKEVVAEFNRYNRHKLVIADTTLETRMFGGAFTPNGYESFVEILQQSFGIVAERRSNETILRLAP